MHAMKQLWWAGISLLGRAWVSPTLVRKMCVIVHPRKFTIKWEKLCVIIHNKATLRLNAKKLSSLASHKDMIMHKEHLSSSMPRMIQQRSLLDFLICGVWSSMSQMRQWHRLQIASCASGTSCEPKFDQFIKSVLMCWCFIVNVMHNFLNQMKQVCSSFLYQ